MKNLVAACALASFLSPNPPGEDAVRPERFVVEPSTPICLGFEWETSGDDNRNAAVEVAWRESGRREWKEALPLLRIGGERVFRDREHLDYTVPHRFAGSILDLEPGAEYECRLTMKDPDRSFRTRPRTPPTTTTATGPTAA
jgi:hypothetical protein